MLCFARALLAAAFVALGVAAAGCSAAEADEETAISEDDLAWSPDRFSFRRPTRGEIDMGNAYWAARLSEIAYLPSRDLDRELQRIGARGEFAFFENVRTDTQAFYLGTPDFALVVFRGTDGGRDVATDLHRIQAPTYFGAIHEGFLRAFRSIWNDGEDGLRIGGLAREGQGLESFLLDRHTTWSSSRPLVFAGHSLGGALATIGYVHASFGHCERQDPRPAPPLMWTCALRAGTRDGARSFGVVYVDAVYTFGAPRAGDAAFADLAGSSGMSGARERQVLFRFVNGNDLVTKVPYFGYYHPRRDRDENAAKIAIGPRTLTTLLPGLSSYVRSGIRNHAMGTYIGQLAAIVAASPPADLPDPPAADDARRRRFVQVLTQEATASAFTWLPLGALDGAALAFVQKSRERGYEPTARSFGVDGELAYVVRVDVDGGAIDGRGTTPPAASSGPSSRSHRSPRRTRQSDPASTRARRPVSWSPPSMPEGSSRRCSAGSSGCEPCSRVTEFQYDAARPLLVEHADLFVRLDLPRALVTWRVVRRTLRRALLREVLWNGNREPPLRTFFSDPDHVVRWAWRTHASNQERVRRVCSASGPARRAPSDSQ